MLFGTSFTSGFRSTYCKFPTPHECSRLTILHREQISLLVVEQSAAFQNLEGEQKASLLKFNQALRELEVFQDILDDQSSKIKDTIRSEHECTRDLAATDGAVTRDMVKSEHEKTSVAVEVAHEFTRLQVVDSAKNQEKTTKLVVETSQAQIVARVEDETVLTQLEIQSTLHAELEATRQQMELTGSKTLEEMRGSMREANFRFNDLKAVYIKMQNNSDKGLHTSQQDSLRECRRKRGHGQLPFAPLGIPFEARELAHDSNVDAPAGSNTQIRPVQGSIQNNRDNEPQTKLAEEAMVSSYSKPQPQEAGLSKNAPYLAKYGLTYQSSNFLNFLGSPLSGNMGIKPERASKFATEFELFHREIPESYCICLKPHSEKDALTNQSHQRFTMRKMRLGGEHPDVIYAMLDLASKLCCQKEYREAENLYGTALEICGDTLSCQELDDKIMRATKGMGGVYMLQKRFDESEAQFRLLLDICETTYGLNHEKTLKIVYRLGFLYYSQGHNSDAEDFLGRAVEGFETQLGFDDECTMDTTMCLGMVYVSQCRYHDALEVFRRVLKSREVQLGREAVETVEVVSWMATVYHLREEFAKAGEIYRKVLQAFGKLLGPYHEQTLGVVGALGYHCYSRELYEEAETHLCKVISKKDFLLKHGRMIYWDALYSLALLYNDTGQFVKATSCCEELLPSQQALYGEQHAQTLRVMSLLGRVYHQRGWKHQSDRTLRPCLSLQNQSLGPTSFDTLGTVLRLANLCWSQGSLDEAAALFERCWHAYEDRLGFRNPSTLETASCLAGVYHHQKQFNKEVLILRTITAAFEAQFGYTGAKTLDEWQRLSIALKELGNFGEAEHLLTRVLAVREAQDGVDSHAALLTLTRIAQVKDAQGLHLEAEALWNRLLSISEARPAFSYKEKLDLLWHLGCNYVDQEKLIEAVPIFDRVWRGLLKMGENVSESFMKLIKVYERLGATEKVEEMRRIVKTIPSKSLIG
jgi:tetratricopeptide (TPR) repeat protein